MSSNRIVKQVEIKNSIRVQQAQSMFDVPFSETAQSIIEYENNIPESWNVGLIVGHSGAGKTTVAQELFTIQAFPIWDSTAAIVDNFPEEMPISEIIEILSKIGFSSPPHWLKPYHVLSNGEQFRVNIARAIAENTGDAPLVIDEFTSVVDRQIAQIVSHTTQKLIRKRNQQFVAVSCHYDIIDWLQPDWILDLTNQNFYRRSLRQRPNLELQIFQCSHKEWQIFKKYHYLTGNINKAAQCFVMMQDSRFVAFSSYLHFPHKQRKNIKMGHRLVVLPDYQGLGIGGKFDDWLGYKLKSEGFEYRNVIAHPALAHYYNQSPLWAFIKKSSRTPHGKNAVMKGGDDIHVFRYTYTFAFVG